MKRTAKTLSTASRISPDISLALFNSLLLPLLIMAGFGAFTIFREGYGLHFVGLLAVSSLLMVVPVLWRKYRSQEEDHSIEDSLVQPSGEWGALDQQIWEQQNEQIPQLLEQNDDWNQLKEHGLTIISCVAKDYGRKELAFSLPELLKMTEEISRRYRKVLLEHAPFIEKIPFSLYKYSYQHQEEAKKGLQITSWLFNAYRAFRLTTPAGIISEIRSRILGETFGSLNTRLQHQLKQALLQEVLSVAIDLYSGRFNIGDDELSGNNSAEHSSKKSEKEKPFTPKPLRVCLIGQVSAGKSSIINALKNELVAETSQLPSTDRTIVYQCSIEGMDTLNLVDLPGFDGNANTEKLLLEQATKANVILWVLKANQPARAIDQKFKARLEEFYQQPQNRSKKQPVIIGILNQTDQLKNEPVIADALDYNRELLGFTDIVPLSVKKNQPAINLYALEQLLDKYFDEGMLVQLNQRRMEAGESINLSEQARRFYQSGKSLFSLIKGNIRN